MTEKYSKWSNNKTTYSIPRPSRFYPNWDFWFENKPSGNPGLYSIDGKYSSVQSGQSTQLMKASMSDPEGCTVQTH
jgi:hypothetical protein